MIKASAESPSERNGLMPKNPYTHWPAVEAKLEAERQALIEARQDPEYDEQADIGSRLLVAGTRIMFGAEYDD